MPSKVDRVPDRNFGNEWSEYLNASEGQMARTLGLEGRFRPLAAQIDYDTFSGLAPQYLELYRSKINPALSRAESEHRMRTAEADTGLLQRWGAPMRQAMLDSDPEAARLINTLSSQSADDLRNRGLPARYRRDLTQDLRAAQAARGTGYGLGDITAESLLTGSDRIGLEDRARSNAAAVLGLRNNQTGGALNLLGRGGISHMTNLLPMTHQLSGTQLLDPQNPYMERLKAGNFQAANQRAVQNAANKAALYSAGIQALGSVAGGFAGGFGKSWGAAKAASTVAPAPQFGIA